MFKNFKKIKCNAGLPALREQAGLPAMPVHARQAGMTLIELLVVISIFAILTSMTIFDYGSFRSSVSINNLADDIALSIRKAQSYAIGVHALSSSNFLSGYGVHFTTGSNKSFVIFNDINNNKFYDATSGCGSGSIECNEVLSITSADKISAIYLNDDRENGKGPIPSNYSMDISFKRPNPDAHFCESSPISNPCNVNNDNASHVEIVVSNDNNIKSETITIWNTGQISVQS
ncbi:MAG TPA: prepilin-type N-terminal cleavage/methylation domain-containing protein [Candidatus Paceibacterota bacterium]|jgi:prepilin-type N-terminal cleavage/methylation domain-containing protein|nr:prepilin-type N-terminal cleavage/methylation domain-containing protein [Candidatus Paceibacterota bacterium]